MEKKGKKLEDWEEKVRIGEGLEMVKGAHSRTRRLGGDPTPSPKTGDGHIRVLKNER